MRGVQVLACCLVVGSMGSLAVYSQSRGASVAVIYEGNFVVLNANPLENIGKTRQINSVYLNGAKLDRDNLLAGWKKSMIFSQ